MVSIWGQATPTTNTLSIKGPAPTSGILWTPVPLYKMTLPYLHLSQKTIQMETSNGPTLVSTYLTNYLEQSQII